ncbi:MAG TPA: hypothetical protein VFT50_15850 [Baekduia sp.]|nr:hypothetical protein [Baekduia sp.]
MSTAPTIVPVEPAPPVVRADPYRSVAREVLCVLAEEDRPMSLRELQGTGRLSVEDAALQLSVARVAGFVRSVPAAVSATEPSYRPTPLGMAIARRSRAGAAARELRRLPLAA